MRQFLHNAIVIILFFLIVTLYFLIHWGILRHQSISEFQTRIQNSFLQVPFEEISYRNVLDKFADPEIASLLILSQNSEILGLWRAEEQSSIPFISNTSPTRIQEIELSYNPVFEVKRRYFKNSYELNAIIPILSENDFWQILTGSMYLLLCFLVLSLLYIFINLIAEPKPERKIRPSYRNLPPMPNQRPQVLLRSIHPYKRFMDNRNEELYSALKNKQNYGLIVFRLSTNFSQQEIAIFESSLVSYFSEPSYNIAELVYGIFTPIESNQSCSRRIKDFLRILSARLPSTAEVYCGCSSLNGQRKTGEQLLQEGMRAAKVAKSNSIVYFQSYL